ncbi:peptidoglycan editing factor PgeF [Stappia taiwanensis]|uniref:Purine nucleoside phosphorylase n=1 Tax=Stappia taiwanensis TaxID=992267 RepID=A0A838XQ77_9HYPH|nr:peptidoglycan editing factor PgeF [Stappia taiwanensis]MBA4611211.1 peptidoglycan editing factor PgeF [Stappia taiwanensis]GGE86804.1 laccase domain protein [Stappia taiwanensis]
MLTSPDLAALDGIVHGFFTREGGVSRGIYASLNVGLGSDDDRAAVIENRTRIATMLGVVPGMLVSPHQHHSADAIPVSVPWTADAQPKGDALVTDRPGLALGIATADCGPVLFADPQARVIAAAHSGWRGALTGILEAVLVKMETLGADRTRVIAVLGPTISQKNYEVGRDFLDRFTAADADNERFFVPSDRPDHFRFDLPAFIGQRLRRAGVGRACDLGRCTYAEPELFYSYRRTTHAGEPDYGRLMSAIALSGG